MILSLNIFCVKTLSMITASEIVQDNILKIFVNEDGVEDEMYGVVGMNTGNTLGVYYLNPTERLYKTACVYELNREEMCPVPYESVMEHHPTGTSFEDLEMKSLGDDLWAFYSEIDMEDEDSEIYNEDDSSDMDSFIVSDGECDLPVDHKAIDKEWNEWIPSTQGASSFKDTVDTIENKIKEHLSGSA